MGNKLFSESIFGLGISLLVTVLLLITPISAQATDTSVDSSGTNSITGADSSNTNTTAVKDMSDTSVANKAVSNTNVTIKVNTGFNTNTANTKVENASTGNISVDIPIVTNLNGTSGSTPSSSTVNSSSVSSSSASVQSNNQNVLTGFNSLNTNTDRISNSTKNTIVNNATINNTVRMSANTGHNTNKSNTLVKNASTGNITINVAIKNNANQGVTKPQLPGGGGTVPIMNPTLPQVISAISKPVRAVIAAAKPTIKPAGGGFFPAGSSVLEFILLTSGLLIGSFILVFSQEIRRLVYVYLK